MEISYEGQTYSIVATNNEDHIAKQIAMSGTFYELDLLEYMRSVRPWMKGDTAVDVGANIGNHSLYFGQFLFEHVFSFEPNAELFEILGDNLGGRGAIHHLIPMAAGAHEGSGDFIKGPDWNSGMGRAVPGAGSIRFTTLDKVLHRQSVAFVKIDVEGGELGVLNGGLELLKTQKPHLFIECSTPAALTQIRAFLAPLGYSSLSRWAATPVYHFAYHPALSLRLFAKAARLRHIVSRFIGRVLAGPSKAQHGRL